MAGLEGKCVGGPWDGKKLGSLRELYEVSKTYKGGTHVVIGEYRFENGEWQWSICKER